jgi:preprotein translocase subunit SecF
MYDIVSKRFWLFLVSGILILIGIISIASPFGRLKLGTEFSSGTQLSISFTDSVSTADLRQELTSLGYSEAVVRTATPLGGGEGYFVIRTKVLNDTEQAALESSLAEKFGTVNVIGFQNVSPEIATETISSTAIAVVVAAVAMLLYIIWAFRAMPHPLRYGTCAIIALLHDVIVTTGIFSLIGAFLGWEVDLMFIIGILTIFGYSVNNTIIVFDRVRENVKMGISSNFEIVVNDSIIGSFGRCLNTSMTTIFSLLALMFFVGATIENFVVVLLIGIIAGTYDSLCVAPNLLVVWQNHEWGRFIGRKTKAIA